MLQYPLVNNTENVPIANSRRLIDFHERLLWRTALQHLAVPVSVSSGPFVASVQKGGEAVIRCTWEERPQYEGHILKGAYRLVKPML